MMTALDFNRRKEDNKGPEVLSSGQAAAFLHFRSTQEISQSPAAFTWWGTCWVKVFMLCRNLPTLLRVDSKERFHLLHRWNYLTKPSPVSLTMDWVLIIFPGSSPWGITAIPPWKEATQSLFSVPVPLTDTNSVSTHCARKPRSTETSGFARVNQGATGWIHTHVALRLPIPYSCRKWKKHFSLPF